jgi:phenylpyruvate tautomerase PptA (4-oxalocrotonate tautomerase family)
MPLYTVLIEEGSAPDQTKARIAEEITDIHTAVMKVPRSFVRVIFLSYPRGSGYARRTGASGRPRLYPSQRPHCRRKSQPSDASVGDVSTPYGNRHGSSRNITPGNPVNQCNGDGADHASCGPGFQ